MTDVRVGSLVFRGGEGMHGFYVENGGLTGWFDGPNTRADQTEIPQGHGDFDVPVFMGSRVISVAGWCHSKDARQMEHFQHQLTGLLAHGGTGRLQVDGPSNSLWADVHRFGQPQFVPEVWGQSARYQVQFWAPDPRKFGETRHFAGGVAAYHYGNFAASPRIYVRATSTMSGGYTINGPAGKKYIVSAALAAGHLHTIDMNTGLLYVDGVDTATFGVVAQGDTWAVPPGQSVAVTLTTGAGAGTLDVAVTDTYV